MEARASVAALAGEPGGAALQYVAHPVQRLDVVDERGAAPEADLGGEGGLVPGLAPLALDAFQHRRLFAADVGPRAPAEDESGLGCEARRVELRDLFQQHLADARIFVAEVDVALGGFDGPAGDQRAFEEAMRVLLHVDPVLDRAGLAFVRIDGHQPGPRLGPDEAPLAPGREARAALSLEAAVLQRADHVVDAPRTRQAFPENPVASAFDISAEIDVSRVHGRMVRSFGAGEDPFHGRPRHVAVADLRHRRLLAAAHAGRPHHPHVVAHGPRQGFQQVLGAETFARQAVADPDRQRRWRALALPSPRRSARRTWRPRTPRPWQGASRPRAPPDDEPRGSHSGPGSCADARSAGLGAWARRPAAPESLPAQPDRPDGPFRCSAPCAARCRGAWEPDFRPKEPPASPTILFRRNSARTATNWPRCLAPSRSTVET